MESHNLSLKTPEERAAIQRDLIASQMANNLSRGKDAQKIAQRLSRMSEEQRADMQQRIDKYLVMINKTTNHIPKRKAPSQHWYRQ
jgi:hypothetical protein